jgi:hypothetical protein
MAVVTPTMTLPMTSVVKVMVPTATLTALGVGDAVGALLHPGPRNLTGA